jgi:hypothetical protein
MMGIGPVASAIASLGVSRFAREADDGAAKLDPTSRSDDKTATERKAGVCTVMAPLRKFTRLRQMLPRGGEECYLGKIGLRDRRGARCRQ